MTVPRPSWDDYFMAMTRIVATRSSCDRLSAGAILVKQKRIIATGYNGAPPGQPNCNEVGHLLEDGHCVRTIHAEHNAILQVSLLQGSSTEGSTLYINYSPCIHCAKYILAAGIKKIVIGKIYRTPQVVDYLKQAGLEVVLYQRNAAWDEGLSEMFKHEIEDRKAPEGNITLTNG
ncbi:MAG: cytidine/deoxycytidylate deaminase family protein [Candidatus Komeilibacteria bacterium]